MADALSVAAVVETLVEMDLVDLNGTGHWPGEPDGADIYEPDWSQIHPAQSDMQDMPTNPGHASQSLYEGLRRRASAGFLEPPTDVIDAQAWYTPLHYFGLGSAIYIREAAVLELAAVIVSRLDPPSARTIRISSEPVEPRCRFYIFMKPSTTRSSRRLSVWRP